MYQGCRGFQLWQDRVDRRSDPVNGARRLRCAFRPLASDSQLELSSLSGNGGQHRQNSPQRSQINDVVFVWGRTLHQAALILCNMGIRWDRSSIGCRAIGRKITQRTMRESVAMKKRMASVSDSGQFVQLAFHLLYRLIILRNSTNNARRTAGPIARQPISIVVPERTDHDDCFDGSDE